MGIVTTDAELIPSQHRKDSLNQAILRWAPASTRRLPWRDEARAGQRDPWAVLVAETMLAQTQAERAGKAYPSFLNRFPTAESMATSPLGDVIALWIGLGYYRRAERLWRCSQIICGAFDGRVPSSYAELITLPGIGPYTARAVLALAFNRDTPPLDVNTRRLALRAFAGRHLGDSEAQRCLDGVVPQGRGGVWSEALFDIGATLCRSSQPLCGTCPLADSLCIWKRDGGPDPTRTQRSRSAIAFEGSLRQLRGRVLRAVAAADGCISEDHVRSACSSQLLTDQPVLEVIESLLIDGLLTRCGDQLRLP